MAVVAVVSQKGGVGKSTLCRLLAREAANSKLLTKIADLDAAQETSAAWHRLRITQKIEPGIPVQVYGGVADALREAEAYDVFVVDCPARASKGTLEVSKVADLIIQPCGASFDDLRPAVRVFRELIEAGIPKTKLVFALCRIGTDAEASDARTYLEDAGFSVLPGCIPEKPAYRQAQNTGRAITETNFSTLNKKADDLIAAIATRLTNAGPNKAEKKKPTHRNRSSANRHEGTSQST